MNVLVTGHRGYIGAHLIPLLKLTGHTVTGCDLDLYCESICEPLCEPDREYLMDIRNLTPAHLKGHHCVIHLAALSNDPMGELDASLTEEINQNGSVHLAKMARETGIARFLFASSCSMYGQAETFDLDESAPLHPQSTYAHSKINAERAISLLATNDFTPAYLRNATAYGASPMLRLDLVVNNLMACAYTRGDIRIMSDGTPWRPLIHAKDMARAFIAFLEAPRPLIHNRAVNIGENVSNFQVRQIANKILNLMPKSKIVFTGEVGADPRNYRVNFDLFATLFPDFKFSYTLDSGMKDLHQFFIKNALTREDFEGGKYMRLSQLKKQLLKF